MSRSKKTSSGGSGASGSTTQTCKQEGSFIVIANLVGTTTRPFTSGLDVSLVQSVSAPGAGGKSGKTDGNGMKEFSALPPTMHTATASLTGGNTAKFELVGARRSTSTVPAGGSTIVNFDVVPLLAAKVRVKVKDSSPPVFLKPERVTLTEAKGRFETSNAPDGTWEFKKLHPGSITIEVRLTPEDREKFELTDVKFVRELTETPQPNLFELEAKRLPVLVPLFFAFKFLDAEAKSRILPGKIPVKVKLSDLVPTKPGDPPAGPDTCDAEINENGLLTPVDGPAPLRVSRGYKKLTLDFTQTDPYFIICDLPGEAASGKAVKYEKSDEFRAKLRAGRGFMLPLKRPFTLQTADWDIKDGAADAKPRFNQLSDTATLFGTPSQMITLTLKPRWQFVRHTFFDRTFGFKDHAKKQISIPRVNLRGYRVMPGKAAVLEAEAAAAECATAEEKERTAFDALVLAQDDRDLAYAQGSMPIYLKNWHAANPGTPKPANIDPDAAAAVTRRTNADAAIPPLQTAYDTAHAAADTARQKAAAKLQAANEAWAKGVADTLSNWHLVPGGDIGNTVQCLPWILNKKPDDTADAGLDSDVVLEFFTSKNAYIESKSATERSLIVIPDGDDRLKAGAQRLKVYDMPKVWRSRRYFARLGAKANRFEQLADKPSTAAEPFTFSLDDIVLCKNLPSGGSSDLKLGVLDDKAWNPSKRCALFHHRFRKKAVDDSTMADVSEQGVYQPDSANSCSFFSQIPSGTAAGTAGDLTVEKDRNYIADYPAWTRLVIAGGNVFDAFDQRSPASPIGVTGARAAVCWHDATAPRSAGSMVYQRLMPNESAAADWQDIPCSNQVPSPGKWFSAGNRPADFGHQFLRIQPFMEFNYGVRYREKFNPANSDGTGRIDFVLVRCCGVLGTGADEREHCVNLHYTKNFFQFVPNPATALAATGLTEAAWKDTWSLNVMNRWNGNDAQNVDRARLLPVSRTDGKPVPKFECDVLWFMQVADRIRSHFMVHVENKGASARDNRGGFDGTGESSPAGYNDPAGNWFPSAHESGHADGLPDEYNEKWWSGSLGQMSYKSNLPGDPFSADDGTGGNGSPMMNGNHIIRNRFFWPSAEWVRRRMMASGVTMQMKVALRSLLGVAYNDYKVMPHATDRRTYAYWPLRHEVDQALPGVRGHRNLYLFALGAEQWTVRDIFARHIAGAAGPNAAEPYDGILVITLHLEFDTPRWMSGAPATVDWDATNTNRRAIFQAVQREVDTRCNFRFKLKADLTEGGLAWTYKRCLVHFSPRFLDKDYHAHTHASGTVDDPISPSVNGVRNNRGTHFLVKVQHDAANPANCVWEADSTVKVTSNLLTNAGRGAIATQVMRAFGQMLGVNKSPNTILGADLLPLVANLNLQNAQITNV